LQDSGQGFVWSPTSTGAVTAKAPPVVASCGTISEFLAEPLAVFVGPDAGGNGDGCDDQRFQGNSPYRGQRQPGGRPPRWPELPFPRRPPKSQMATAKIAPIKIKVSKTHFLQS